MTRVLFWLTIGALLPLDSVVWACSVCFGEADGDAGRGLALSAGVLLSLVFGIQLVIFRLFARIRRAEIDALRESEESP